jgi:hypothetical protein
MSVNHPGFRVVLPLSFASVVVAVVATSVAMGASLSTSALLLLLGTAPLGVALLIASTSAGPTIAEVLHVVDSREGR